MAVGNTTTGSLADSLQLIIDSARLVREFEGVFMRTTETHTLEENTGLSWEEIEVAQLTAQNVTENTVLANPQQYSDSLFTLTPAVTGLTTIVTDRTYRRVSSKTIAAMGPAAQNAIQRKKDQDYLTVLDGATTSLCGAGSTLTSGHIAAAARRITSNATEPGVGEIFTVLHGFQIKDIQDEVVAGVGTYTVPDGLTEDVFRKGFMGSLFGTNVFEDGNIAVYGSDDAKGGVHTREAVLMIQGHAPKTESKRLPEVGGGADQMFYYDEYIFGERNAGIWLYEIYSDATTPTS
jgi:hypothetical protein